MLLASQPASLIKRHNSQMVVCGAWENALGGRSGGDCREGTQGSEGESLTFRGQISFLILVSASSSTLSKSVSLSARLLQDM